MHIFVYFCLHIVKIQYFRQFTIEFQGEFKSVRKFNDVNLTSIQNVRCCELRLIGRQGRSLMAKIKTKNISPVWLSPLKFQREFPLDSSGQLLSEDFYKFSPFLIALCLIKRIFLLTSGIDCWRRKFRTRWVR